MTESISSSLSIEHCDYFCWRQQQTKTLHCWPYLIIIHDPHSLQSHETTATKTQVRLACSQSNSTIWDEWLIRRSPLGAVSGPDIKNLSKTKLMTWKVTCMGWNPRPRSSFCQFSVCGVPSCEHPPWHTASACTLSIHFPAPSPAASAPPLSPFLKETSTAKRRRRNAML